MDSQMRDIDQKIFNFSNNKNFKDEDFYLSSSNRHIYNMLNNWPKCEKNFLNIVGENFSGKTHLMNIFLKKFNGIKIESNLLSSITISSSFVNQSNGSFLTSILLELA